MTLIVRTQRPPATLTASIRDAVIRTHPNVAIFGVATMDDVVR